MRYKTKQRDAMIAYLESSIGTRVTASDVEETLKATGQTASRATVYRILEQLVEEGLVRKMPSSGRQAAYFEYLGTDEENATAACCVCRECGKLVHVHCGELTHIRQHVANEHGFAIDSRQTMLHGTCEDCLQKRDQQ